MNKENESVEDKPLFIFTAGGERFGIDAGAIQEVIKFNHCAPIPFTKKCILGVCNLRGYPLIVCHLSSTLGVYSPAPPQFVLVASYSPGELIGLAVDGIAEVKQMNESQIHNDESTKRKKYVQGLLATQEGFVTVLDFPLWYNQQEFSI